MSDGTSPGWRDRAIGPLSIRPTQQRYTPSDGTFELHGDAMEVATVLFNVAGWG